MQAAADGDVTYVGDMGPGQRRLAPIRHEHGWFTAYAHLARINVRVKDHVSQGDAIGEAGEASGARSPPDVYFEIRYAAAPTQRAAPVDPALLLASPGPAAASAR